MSEIMEEMLQGYCRSMDQSRIVTCEYHIEMNQKVYEYTDCAFGKCVHSDTCVLMKSVREANNKQEGI